MSYPSAVHPVTGRPRDAYITLVIERCTDDARFPTEDIAHSIVNDVECKTIPGYRVRDMSSGDYVAAAIHDRTKEQTS